MRGSMEHLMWLKWKERTGLNLIDPRAENYGWNSIMLLNFIVTYSMLIEV
jgi:hypothetical protein